MAKMDGTGTIRKAPAQAEEKPGYRPGRETVMRQDYESNFEYRQNFYRRAR